MVYGGPADEQIQLNEESIYAGKRMDRQQSWRTQKHSCYSPPAARRQGQRSGRTGGRRTCSRFRAASRLMNRWVISSCTSQASMPQSEISPGTRISMTASPRCLSTAAACITPERSSPLIQITRLCMHLEASRAGALNFLVSLTRAVDATSSLESNIPNTIVLNGTALPPKTMPMNRKKARNLPAPFASMRMAKFFPRPTPIKFEIPKK